VRLSLEGKVTKSTQPKQKSYSCNAVTRTKYNVSTLRKHIIEVAKPEAYAITISIPSSPILLLGAHILTVSIIPHLSVSTANMSVSQIKVQALLASTMTAGKSLMPQGSALWCSKSGPSFKAPRLSHYNSKRAQTEHSSVLP